MCHFITDLSYNFFFVNVDCIFQINSQNQSNNSSSTPDFWSNYVTRKNIDLDGSDHGSSPRTPAEMYSISGMPNSVATETEMNIKSKDLQETSQEFGNAPTPVVFHPLSPDLEINQYNSLNCKYAISFFKLFFRKITFYSILSA